LNQILRRSRARRISKPCSGTWIYERKIQIYPEPIIEKIIPTPNPTLRGRSKRDEVGDMEIELDEKNLAKIDLVSLEEAYQKKELSFIPPDQLRKVHKVYLNSTG
jgi:hypothetical protein